MASRCPICGNALPGTPEAERWRPFCSSRCQTIDLGKWLDGAYRVVRPPDEEEADQGEPGRGTRTPSDD